MEKTIDQKMNEIELALAKTAVALSLAKKDSEIGKIQSMESVIKSSVESYSYYKKMDMPEAAQDLLDRIIWAETIISDELDKLSTN